MEEGELMPTYCFRDSEGRAFEEFYSLQELERMELRDGVYLIPKKGECTIAMDLQHSGFQHRPDLWREHWSDSCGVGTHEIPKKMAEDAKRGVSVEYCPTTGRAKFNSMAHRREYCKKYGLVDRNSYNG